MCLISKKVNFLKINLLGFLFLVQISGNAQSFDNPSVSSLMSFEHYPVNHSTGMPFVNIPLYKMPTRIKDITVDVSLNYHPSSVAFFNQNTGDCGKGWSLSKGGAILRTLKDNPDEYSWQTNSSDNLDLYEFRFFGYSGKFRINKNGNQLEVSIFENGGEPLKIGLNYNSTTYLINSFTISDNKGYVYVFDIADEYYFQINKTYKQAYHLTSIKDTNNNILVSFNYNKYYSVRASHNLGQKDTFHIMSSISSPGFGQVVFNLNYSDLYTFYYNTNYWMWAIQYTGFQIKNMNNSTVREVLFSYDYLWNMPENRFKLIKIEEKAGNKTREYKLFYKSTLLHPDMVVGIDTWGYYNAINKWDVKIPTNPPQFTNLSRTATKYATEGVLQKILFPTGGSILYDYELNTYSYANQKRLDASLVTGSIDPEFYYKIDNIDHYNSKQVNNLHNYSVDLYATKNFNSSLVTPLTFNVSGTKRFYFEFDATPHTVIIPDIVGPDGNPVVVTTYPEFKLKKSGTTVQEFKITNNYFNYQNGGLGKYLDLTSGSYTLEMTHTSQTSGKVSINQITPITPVKKWWYGGGIRIKRIGYFDKSVDLRHYDSTNPLMTPVREINFNYNLFDEPDRSSGYLKPHYYHPTITDFGKYDLIRYSNITVSDTGNNGKITYNYYSPMDNPSTADLETNYRVGHLKEIIYYNNLNQKVKKINYSYDPELSREDLIVSLNSRLGWMAPTEIKETLYSGNSELVNTFSYKYNTSLKVREVTSLSGVTENDKTVSKYFYHTGNSPFTQNRNVIEQIEEYRGDKLLFTSKITYSDTWPILTEDQGAANTSYLPQKIETAKADNDYKQDIKVNLYDRYGNIVEYENEGGKKVVNIWGYHKTQIVAKLENISYSQIPQDIITIIHIVSNGGTEAGLLSALNALRSHSATQNALITTFTYKPLIGVSTLTDIRGYRTTYIYDDFGRLIQEKDESGNILTEHQYNSKLQN